jgi:hypothetical protein
VNAGLTKADWLQRLEELRGWTPEAIGRLGLREDTREGLYAGRVVFDVRDATGELLGTTSYQPDPGLRNDADGRRKMLAERGVPRELFLPPEMIDDDELGDDRILLLVEGEPDAVRAWSIGIPAVAVPGVGIWKNGWAARFAGRRLTVAVIFDCDPEGRGHAPKVGATLARHGVDVRIVDLDKHRDDKFDFTDFLAAARTAEEREEAALLLRKIVLATPMFEAEPTVHEEPAPADAATVEPTFVIETFTARELCELPDPYGNWQLLGPYVIRGGRLIVVGDTGEGKTALVMQFVRGVVTGDDVLGHTGVGEGPALILDLEQGLRSAKRAVRVAGLHERDDVHVARCPDGLALDSNSEHVAALRALLEQLRPVVVALDPYYKLYRHLDPNEEHGVVELMRFLDALRVEFGFALILPAHPRKDQPGRVGIRKLTIHDVAGSGALTRGVEVVLGIERGNPGFARLRVLKDRDGDLLVGKAVGLIFNRDHGFQLDPREQVEQAELDRRAVEIGSDGKWRTLTEFTKELGVGKARARMTLEHLTEAGELEYEKGPEGRRFDADCWRTSGSGAPDHIDPEAGSGVSGTPLSASII